MKRPVKPWAENSLIQRMESNSAGFIVILWADAAKTHDELPVETSHYFGRIIYRFDSLYR